MRHTLTCLLLLALLTPQIAWCEDFPAQVEKPIDHAITIRQQTQAAADRWETQRRKLAAEYDRLAAEQEKLAASRDRLGKTAAALRSENDALNRQLAEMARIAAELTPFLEQTYRRLADLVATDTPFLAEERKDRLQRLRQTLDDPLVTTGEKYRKVMEALFVEAQYGNTVEIYREQIVLDGRQILADIFRLGRISLFFQTLDGQTAGHWNPETASWISLPETDLRPIHDAMEMAAKRRSAELISLPLGRIAAQ